MPGACPGYLSEPVQISSRNREEVPRYAREAAAAIEDETIVKNNLNMKNYAKEVDGKSKGRSPVHIVANVDHGNFPQCEDEAYRISQHAELGCRQALRKSGVLSIDEHACCAGDCGRCGDRQKRRSGHNRMCSGGVAKEEGPVVVCLRAATAANGLIDGTEAPTA